MILNRLKKHALPISLAFNVFFVAVIGIHLWHRPPPHHGRHGPHDMVEEIARTLSAADAAILRREFAPGTLPEPPRPGSPDDGLERIRQVLAAEPFDPAALDAVLRADEEHHRQYDRAIAGARIRAATALSAEGRHRLAEWQPHGPPPQ